MLSTDDFQSDYRFFVQALGMLASSAVEQCEAMGDYNVAWELKDDVQAGRFLIGRGFLSAEQEAWILALTLALDAVPATTLPAGEGRHANLAAMHHPSWIPLRIMARHALEALSPATGNAVRVLDA
jgi:hypothetical protein